MITNLFSIFDPATSINFSTNWVGLFNIIFFLPLIYWVSQNRLSYLFNSLTNYIFNEFKPLIKKTPLVLITPLTLFLIILLNNVPGLLPFIFTSTRHISLSMSIALPLWVGLILYSWICNTSNTFIHLIPNRTPFILIPFIVLIETIRNIIRPLTLSIRLSANITAGHLLISLLTNANRFTPLTLSPLLFSSQLILTRLEIAVAFIQAYVFSVLITLYSAERVS